MVAWATSSFYRSIGCVPPGSQARSPSPSPLRTQRATFTALRSSLTNGPARDATLQVADLQPLDESPAQGPCLDSPGPRTLVGLAYSL